MIIDRYYFNKLNSDEKKIYSAIYNGIKDYKDYVEVPGVTLNNKVVGVVYYFLLLDNPFFFSIGEYAMQHAVDGNRIKITSIFDKTREAIGRNKIEVEINEILSNPKILRMTDYQKVKFVHDYLIEHVVYDNSHGNNGEILNPYTTYGVFVDYKAVCEGIAKATKLLLNAMNVKCIVVSGDTESGEVNHAWNIVKLGNCSYHLDVTFDMGKTIHKGYPHYDYFNLSDAVINRKPINQHLLPKCDSMEMNFVSQNHGIVSDEKSMERCFSEAINNHNSVIGIKIDRRNNSALKNETDICGLVERVFFSVARSLGVSTSIFIDTTGYKEICTIEVTYT